MVKRAHTSPVWKHLHRILKHNVSGRVMNGKCTHVCVYKLSLQLSNMTSSPTFLTPTCSRCTWICWRATNNVSRQVSQSSLDTCLWWLSVLSCVKLVVSDSHVRLKPSEIRILVMFRMNHGFMEYKMRRSEDFLVYKDWLCIEFKKKNWIPEQK
jgi:hypothetical protein